MNSILSCLTSDYFNFSGRASRSEFWFFILFLIIVEAIIDMIFPSSKATLISVNTVIWMATLLPCISVTTRRLHDTNRSGWWQLINFIPLLGWIIMLIFLCWPSTEGSNNYN